MGVYSNKSLMEESVNLLSEDIDISDIQDPANYADQIMIENEINYSRIMQYVGISELHDIENVGYVLNESTNGFWSKVKSFFAKIFEKIKKFFKNLIIRIQSLFMDSKKFAKKYEKQISRIIVPKDFEFNGYKFDHMTWEPATYGNAKSKMKDMIVTDMFDLSSLQNMDKDEIDKAINDYDETETYNKLRALVLEKDAGNPIEKSEWNAKLKEFFLGDKDTLTKSDIDISAIRKQLIDEKDTINNANKAYNKLSKDVKDAMNSFNNAEEKYATQVANFDISDENQKGMKEAYPYVSKMVAIANKIFNEYVSITLSAVQAYNNAISTRARQGRAIITKLMTHSESVESFGMTHSDPFELV